MGNTNTKAIASFTGWEKVQTEEGCEVYKNNKSNELAEKRTITIDPHFDLDDELKIYHMRQHNNDSLVRAYGAQEVQKKGHSQGICSGHKKLDVLTEKMPYRLVDLPQLTFPQSLLFLRQSLRAYMRVFKSYGPIHITKKLIGINEFGQVKCWVNQNWAVNHPNHDLPTLQSTKLQGLSQRSGSTGSTSEVYDARYRDQTEMVHNIVAVVEQKCEQGKFPQAFSEQVEHHSSSFRKLTMYVQDFIRINELFIPPKINYETVFISKYQVRLAEQHQKSGQQTSVNQGQNISNLHNLSSANENQNQRIVTTTSIGSTGGEFNTGYVTGANQQLGYGQVSSNYGNTIFQGQQGLTGINILTKTTTTTYGNTFNQGQKSLTTTYQPPSYLGYTASSNNWTSPNNDQINTTTLPTVPWQKAQSLYKPAAQNQSTYSSSFYQYSTSNPSSTVGQNYKFGTGLSSGPDFTLRTQTYKPSSYSLLGNNNSTTPATYNYPSSTLNQNLTTFTSLQNKFGSSTQNNDNPLSPFSPYQNLTAFNGHKTQVPQYTGSTPSKQTYEEFKKSFGSNKVGEANVVGNTMYGYNTATQPPFGSDSAYKGSTYSFDGNKEFSSKFGEYSGKGYTNTLASYETTNGNEASGLNSTGMKVEGKYANQFNSILGSLMGSTNFHNSQQNTNGQLKV